MNQPSARTEDRSLRRALARERVGANGVASGELPILSWGGAIRSESLLPTLGDVIL